jgi:hypothetical protein
MACRVAVFLTTKSEGEPPSVNLMRSRESSLDLLRLRVREDQARLEAQMAVVAQLKAHGRPIEVAEMLVRAYQKFLKQSLDDLAIAEAENRRGDA